MFAMWQPSKYVKVCSLTLRRVIARLFTGTICIVIVVILDVVK